MVEPKEIEEKIKRWIKQENINVEKKEDEKAYFNFKVTIGGDVLNIISPKKSVEKITIATGILLDTHSIGILEKMDSSERQNFYAKLVYYIWDNKSDYILQMDKEILRGYVLQKHIFYDGLTKDRLFLVIMDIKSMNMILKNTIAQEIMNQTPMVTKSSGDLVYIS